MNGLGIRITALCAVFALAAAPAVARRHSGACCHVPAGTAVEVELTQVVSTKTEKAGDSFTLRLAEPLIVEGRIVLPAGAPGVGEVVESAKPGLGGKSAKLVLAARYLHPGGQRVSLVALQLSAAGRDNSMAAQAVGLTGIAFAPLGFIGLAIHGGDVTFPIGTRASARLAGDVFLGSLGPASHEDQAAANSAAAGAAQVAAAGSLDIPPPPAGEGQVVFFRRKSIMGTGQWFNVRENGAALGKLTNGAYFVQPAGPGQHTYTAKTEPELKDKLTLEIDAGETYYVEGTLTKGVVIGTADISPSDRAAFESAAADLKPAPPPTAETAASDSSSGDAASGAAAAP
jgi:hypothetical protein